MSTHYAMCKYDDDTGTYVPLEVRPITDELIQDDPLYKLRASSRDAEIAELVGVLGDVTAHLVAAHSLLSRGGKKAAASDTIFKIMLQDYEKSFEAGRKALAKVRKPTFFEAGRQSVIEGCDDGTIDWRGENEV